MSDSKIGWASILLLAVSLMTCFARADQLADTQADFSLSAQGANGFQYGAYDGYNLAAPGIGTFNTANFVPSASNWDGQEGLTTPSLWNVGQHPGFSSLRPAVRRYTVGSNGEPSVTGLVEIQGSFNDLDSGHTNGFVTVNGINVFYHDVTGTVPFDLFAAVLPGSTIDFGVDAAGDGGLSDSTGLTATITAVPEPAFCGLFVAGTLVLTRRRK
jgi:hypothetical protein